MAILGEFVFILNLQKRGYKLWTLYKTISGHTNVVIYKTSDNLDKKKLQHVDENMRSRKTNTCKRMLDIIPLATFSACLSFVSF